ncbi:hypothetical protein GIB67_006346 [Kingdonia uniflora]|uniref:Uncharacterized protein n=1 Tax=Kingdonia uniflora TaxID=39325 RepID=A0A7J7P0W7_9MAGN|nr:hypothetical protein GIB67_006346 [Kingdonia uniflora]
MEILRSKAGANIVESARRKMVKQICSLIETIQCHHAEGFFGDFTLDKYVERTIKNRYSHALGDIVHRIYSRLDLFMFDNDDVGETLGPLQNSKDCNAELREKEDENEIDKNDREGKASTSGSLNHKGNNRQSPGGIKNNLQHSLLKAHERRERARRFGSFPTRILDLQRVWAPKQPQAAMKLKSESLSKHPKRKKQQGHYDVVCETPIKGKKRSFTRNIARNEEQANFEIDSCASVSKALFQDTDT